MREVTPAARRPLQLFFILGADALREIARWRDPSTALSLATLLVAKRPGAVDPDLSIVRSLAPDARVSLLESPLVDLSSRELRGYARGGGSLRYLVPDAAWRYAASRGLYGQAMEER